MENNIFLPEHFERKLAIVMPVYNEEESLGPVIKEWVEVVREAGGVLILINDGSTDGSLHILKSQNLQKDKIVIIDKKNEGHGPSCLEGYRWAIGKKFQWVFQTDSDGQTSVEDFLRIWNGPEREEFDFIFGLRNNRGDGLYRKFVSQVLKTIIRIIFGIYVEDANTPFRLMKTVKLNQIIDSVPRDLFLANAFLTVTIQKNFSICWQKISFKPRKAGKASVTYLRFFKIGRKVVREFWRYRFI